MENKVILEMTEMKEVRNDSYALYKNKEYIADRPFLETKIHLYSTDSEDVKRGFREYMAGRYEKAVEPHEIESAYSALSYALYKGHPFQVVKINGDKILLYHAGPSPTVEALGFEMVDRFEYELEVDRSEIEKFWEERTPLWGFSLPPVDQE
jgi:hypothetical protein